MYEAGEPTFVVNFFLDATYSRILDGAMTTIDWCCLAYDCDSLHYSSSVCVPLKSAELSVRPPAMTKIAVPPSPKNCGPLGPFPLKDFCSCLKRSIGSPIVPGCACWIVQLVQKCSDIVDAIDYQHPKFPRKSIYYGITTEVYKVS